MARFRRSLVGRALVIGVDRLDYSKGLPQRFIGYDQFLAQLPRPPLARELSPGDADLARRRGAVPDLAAGARRTGRAHQRRLRRAGLGAAALHDARGRPPDPGGLHAPRAGGAGDAAPGRHEPRRQGVRRGAGPGRSGRAGAVPLRRRGALPDGRPAGEPARPGRDRRSAGPGDGHAAGGAAGALAADDGGGAGELGAGTGAGRSWRRWKGSSGGWPLAAAGLSGAFRRSAQRAMLVRRANRSGEDFMVRSCIKPTLRLLPGSGPGAPRGHGGGEGAGAHAGGDRRRHGEDLRHPCRQAPQRRQGRLRQRRVRVHRRRRAAHQCGRPSSRATASR